MARCRRWWTLHDPAWPELAAPTLPSRQGVTGVRLAPTPHTNSGPNCPDSSPLPHRRGHPRALLPADTPTGSPSSARNHTPRTETKPIKDRTSSCALVHCTVYSISRRPHFSCSPASSRRETEQTFFSANNLKQPIPFLSASSRREFRSRALPRDIPQAGRSWNAAPRTIRDRPHIAENLSGTAHKTKVAERSQSSVQPKQHQPFAGHQTNPFPNPQARHAPRPARPTQRRPRTPADFAAGPPRPYLLR